MYDTHTYICVCVYIFAYVWNNSVILEYSNLSKCFVSLAYSFVMFGK